MVIIAETEIWPNFLRACRQRSVPVMMVNGRISNRSFARYMLIRGWLRRVLADYTLIGMQSEADRRRIEDMGGDPGKIAVLGNLKYDIPGRGKPLDAALGRILSRWNPVWIAASTMAGEEELVLDAFEALRPGFPELTLVIAPRHPERFDAVEATVRRRGLSCLRRTSLSEAAPQVRTRLPARPGRTSFCSTPSASSTPSLNMRASCLWEARWPRPEATTFWSPPGTVNQLSLARTWRTFARWRSFFWKAARRFRSVMARRSPGPFGIS
jgi:hypothetical protein